MFPRMNFVGTPINKARTRKENEDVILVFLMDIKGTRQFPIDRRKSYRFDSGSNKTHRMPRRHAEKIIAQNGPDKFAITEL